MSPSRRHPAQSFPSSGSPVRTRSAASGRPSVTRFNRGAVRNCNACELLKRRCTKHRRNKKQVRRDPVPGCHACAFLRTACSIHREVAR